MVVPALWKKAGRVSQRLKRETAGKIKRFTHTQSAQAGPVAEGGPPSTGLVHAVPTAVPTVPAAAAGEDTAEGGYGIMIQKLKFNCNKRRLDNTY